MKKTDPIVVFDSGMGGISVLREIVKLMPNEDIIYFGDSKNSPYGTKSMEVVRELTLGHIEHFVRDEHVKGIAIACNTATSAAVKTLRNLYPEIPLVGVEPAIKPAVLSQDHPSILVMATPVTIGGKKLHDLEAQYKDQALIYPLACPGLMEYVERGVLTGPELEQFLHELIDPYLEKGINGIVLGCTHYPFLKDTIARIAGPQVRIFDGGSGTARELRRRITEADLARNPEHKGRVTFLNSSKDPERLSLSRELFLGDTVQKIQKQEDSII